MTTLAAATEAAYQRWKTAWAALPAWALPLPGGGTQTSVGYVFGNDSFDPPADGGAWARVVVRETFEEQSGLASPGNRLFDAHARVLLQMFAATDVGDQPLAQLVDAAKGVFRGYADDTAGIEFYGPILSQGPLQDGRSSFVVLDIPFLYRLTY